MTTTDHKTRYHYHLVRFIPSPETEEFANVGVILVEPQSGRMRYRLATDLPKRVARFFPGLSPALYEEALAQFGKWCEQLRQGTEEGRASARHAVKLIEESGSRQLPLVRVGYRRTRLGDDNAARLLDKLYRDYVELDLLVGRSTQERGGSS